jgi:hypothetical protein
MQRAFWDIKNTMEARDPRRVIVDFYLKSLNELTNATVYRGALLMRDQEPAVWERYKSGYRVDAAAYTASLKALSSASNAPAGPKAKNSKPKTAITIDRVDILVLLLQYLINEENRCQARSAWPAAAQKAFNFAKANLYRNLKGSEAIAADLDTLFEEMKADAQKEVPLLVAHAIRRELPPEEQAKLGAAPALKDKMHFDREMAGAKKGSDPTNPLASTPTDSDEKEDKSEESSFEKKIEKKLAETAQKAGFGLFEKVLDAATEAVKKTVK